MEAVGTIKSSTKHGSSFRPTNAEPALLATAKQFLESFQFDTRIRQMLREEKLAESVGKHKYYILGHEQKYEPGFLLVMKGQPVVFLSGRLQYAFALRMRLHASLYQTGAIFLATLDTVFATLRLEDVWFLNGHVHYTEPFSKRYDVLQTFASTLFVQDKQLSGFTLTVAKFSPLSDLRKIVESKEFYSVDFVPEHGGRRRWHLPLAFTQQQKEITIAPFNPKGPEKTLVEKVIPSASASTSAADAKKESYTEAIARKIVGMPDTYALQSKTNVDLGRGAVQTSGISMLLRNEFFSKKKEAVPVAILWNEEFKRYKITGLLDS
jgi:hypothetical protein